MIRAIRRFAILIPALLAISITGLQAQAAGVGGGAITGTVNLSPGFATPPPAGLDNQTFTFNSVVLTGAAASTQCAGVVTATASASGSSIAETVAGGVGTGSISASGTCTIGSLNCGCTFVYVRVGCIVIIIIICTVSGQAAASVGSVPVSLFLPNQTPPATTTSATFAGVWNLASA